jgi:hypothetical protein
MNKTKYRKIFLEFNWGVNEFIMVKKQIFHFPNLKVCGWKCNRNEICIGYKLRKNLQIFRPVFSKSRQIILDRVNLNIKNNNFWNKIKSRYFESIVHIKILPIVCIDNIISMLTYH